MLRAFVFILMIAAFVYAVMWVIDKSAQNRRKPGGGTSSPAKPAPRGPDDDEDFLRDLDWRRIRDERRSQDPDDTTGTP